MVNSLQNKQEEQEIDLLKLLKVLLSRIWIIAAAAIVGGVAFLLFTFFFITPKYQSSALLYVNNNSLNLGSTKLNISSGDITASSSLIDTYAVILKSRTTLEQAIREGALPYSYEQLTKMVSGSAEGKTPVFKITVTDTNPEMAAHICNTIVEIMVDENSGISGIVEGSSVRVIDYAVVATKKSSPSNSKNAVIGMLLGFVVACGVIILMSLMDTTIREEEYLMEAYKDIPVLANIPNLLESASGGYYGYGSSYAKASDKAKKAAAASSKTTKEGGK